MIQAKRTNPIILVLVVVLGFLGGFYYYYQNKDLEVPIPESPISQDVSILQFKTLNFDFTILDRQQFKSLKPVGNVTKGEVGKKNVFTD